MRFRGGALALAVIVLESCSWQGRTPSETKTGQATSAQIPNSGSEWERTRECAAQADRLIERSGWKEGERSGSVTFTGYENHYSPKYQRCFVQRFFTDSQLRLPQSVGDPLPFSSELYDAFEGRFLATCATSQIDAKNIGCNVFGQEHSQFDCAACRRFIDDRMER